MATKTAKTIKIDREKFIQVLDSVHPGVAKAEIREQSNCYIFTKGEVFTFNDEVSCRAASLLSNNITGAVRADPLRNILAKIDDDEIEIIDDEKEFIVKGARKELGVTKESEIRLDIDLVDPPTDWKPLHEDFADAVNIVHQCSGSGGDNEEFRKISVRIHPKWLEASDGFKLCRWKIQTDISEPTLVKAQAIKSMASLGMSELSLTDSWVHFRNPHGLILSCRRYIDDDYPDLSDAFKVKGSIVALPKGLVEAAERAEVFSAEITDNNQVSIILENGKVKIKGQGINGWYRETRKVKYDGPRLAFLISPQLLKSLVEKYPDCVVSSDKLKIDAGRYQFVCCLEVPSDEQSLPIVEEDSEGTPEQEEQEIKKEKRNRIKKEYEKIKESDYGKVENAKGRKPVKMLKDEEE